MAVRADKPPVEGVCDPRFAAVRDAFVANLTARGELGAAVAIVVGGRPVVDLWGGFADAARRREWRPETLVNVFSVGTALAAICALRLVERGVVDLDAPLAACWPAFAAAGKEAITLREVLAHRAGLPAVRVPLADDAMLDWEAMTAALAHEEPWWPPGAAHGYHVHTFGFLVGEVVRRVTGATLGTLLRTEIAGPLGADVHVGLAAAEHGRVAEVVWPASDRAFDAAALADGDRMRWYAHRNPRGISGDGWVNTAAWRAAEIPSTNGHGTARGIARVYAALARSGAIDGVRVLAAPVLHAAVVEHSAGLDLVARRPSRFGLGFQLTQPERPLGPHPGAFGHFGAGGALGFCDPEVEAAFGYVTNEMGPGWQTPRNRALVDALYACL